MNERIKQLAVEAGMIIGEANGFDMTQLMPREVKFAELIVRECAGVGYDASYYECALNVSNKIKQHFGVEE